ncbi:AMP-binding protein [Paracoccus sanguinis]|uniref:Amino acid adenylation domain-containing protein n=2 Tax=Paracoccus sanguinis TaxID=1545044 RepID=A0A1H2ZNE4_9RHOB|nr:AMP-binding protein [Paracoccus sanguinis]SDX18841.1 amino acid adenylation domain-containing protein [Paracoccus sanguinis]
MTPAALSLDHLLWDNAALHPDRVALIDADQPVSYGALADRAGQVAAWLAAAGVRRGDRVVVHLRKSADEIAAMFGAARLGAAVVNIAAQWSLDQLAYVLDDTEARALVTSAPVAAALAARPEAEGVAVLALGPGAPPLPPTTAPEAVPVLDSDIAMILYTSGSTGRPKGVMLTHRNVLTGARAVTRYLGLGPDDRLMSVLPFSFDYGLNQLTTMMLVGGTLICQPVPLPAEIVASVNRHAATGLACVPPLWARLAAHLAAAPTPMPSIRRITNTGGAIPGAVLEALPRLFPGAAIHLMYGLTESFRSTHLDPERFAAKRGSIGRAIPAAEVYVVRAGEGLAGPGETGELVHRGPLVSAGYWRRPEATAEKIRPCPELAPLIGDEKVVHSGDIVRIDADGDLWFVGRRDAMMKVMGFRLSPEEVEEVAHASGQVMECVAFGTDNPLMGQAVHLALVPRPGFDRAALESHFRRHAPSYMLPQALHLWEGEMPRISSGKIDRQAVAARFSKEPT